MDMLNNLRDLLNVKNVPVISGEIPINNKINPDAAGELLEHFHKQWEEVHNNNETNANLADQAADAIGNIHLYITSQNEHITAINQLLTSLPTLQNTLQTCNSQIQQLCKSFEQVEEDLLQFEDVIEQCELEKKKNNHRYQLALYEEKKMANLEILRAELSKKHEQEVMENEVKKREAMQERQLVFQDAFKTDLETYKALGTIPKIQVNQSSALLEEIQLDIDDKELMDFLDEK